MIFLERAQLIELEQLLSNLLSLKDSDFSTFLNNSELLTPLLLNLQIFWSTSSIIPEDELTLNLHQIFFKFLLRLCPSFNGKHSKQLNSKELNSKESPALRSVICPKKIAETLFDSDPLGLLCYLFETWYPTEYFNIIRDDLVPPHLLKHSVFKTNSTLNPFTKWLTETTFNGPIKNQEKESILRRFEYESDDDFFEDDYNSDTEAQADRSSSFDPLQAILFSTYTSSPSVFSRTSATRMSPQRTNLLAKTKLSHEQVEGWAVMLERNPKKSNLIQNFIIWSKNNPRN